MGGTTLKLTSGLVSLSGCHEHGRRPGADQEVETAEGDTSKVAVLLCCTVRHILISVVAASIVTAT